MEEGYSEQRQVGFRKFLTGFVGDKDSLATQDDPILFRGSVVGSFRLHAKDVPAEIHDWVQLYLYQRKCPQDLALVLAREVQSRMEALLPSIVPSVTNGGTTGTDSPEEGPYLLDSSLLYREMLSQLHQVCSQLNSSEAELASVSTACRPPQYQTSLVALKNTRRKMEDRHVVVHDLNALCGLVDGPAQSYYAIFDGHSGAEAANFCSAHLHWNLVQHPKFECDPETAFREAFATTEEQFERRSQREGIKSGCTAVCCLIREKQFYLAWLGDSQAILVKKGMPVAIMSPHKPERPDEKERVEKMGGCVMLVGTWRVNGILAVSRALGDFEHKPCVSSEPDINRMDLDGDEDFLVIACDGLWDTLSPNDVTAAVYHFINQVDDIDDIAAQVAQQAIERGSTDNVTAIIVFLRDLQTLASQSAVTSFSSDSVVNHGFNMLDEIDSTLNSKGYVFENGDKEHDFRLNTFSESAFARGQEDIFRKFGGFAPEQTSISELPTPPIEDLMDAEAIDLDSDCHRISTNPFESNDSNEMHDSHAKEIASAILSSALESAALGDSEFGKLGSAFELDSNSQRPAADSAFFSGLVEVNPPLEVVAENDNVVEAQKPWVLQVQHSSQINEVDYLPSAEVVTQVPDEVGQFPDFYASDITALNHFSTDQNKADDLCAPMYQISLDSDTDTKNEMQNTAQASLLLEQEAEQIQELSPEMLKEAEMELKEVQSVLLQSAQVLAGDHQLSGMEFPSDEFTSIQHSFGLQASTQLFQSAILQSTNEETGSHDDKVEDFLSVTSQSTKASVTFVHSETQSTVQQEVQNQNPFDMLDPQNNFGFSEEISSTLISVKGMPGGSEAVSQTSALLFTQEPGMDSQKKEVLAVFEDILIPCSPDQQTSSMGNSELLHPKLQEIENMELEVLEVPETPEHVLKLTETILSPSGEGSTTKGFTPGNFLPVQNNLLVDFIAPQMIVPELNDPEAVANLLASDVPPTPEVVLEKIPDGVPEADGVTEDSDSEKDGGWSYVSAKSKDPSTDKPLEKKPKAGATPTMRRISGTAKETPKTSTPSRTATMKPADSKLKAKTAPSKPASQVGPTTLKKTPSDPAKKPTTSTLVKTKPPTTTIARVSAGACKTGTVTSTTTVTKEVEVKSSVTKSTTMSRPASTLSKKTTPTAKPLSTNGGGAAGVKITQSTITKTATMKPNKPAPATTAPRSTATAGARPATATMSRQAPKPTTAARPASATVTLSKKPAVTAVPKTSTNTLAKVSSARPLSTLTKTQKPNAEIKQTKETVNKQLVNQPGTIRNKLNSMSTNKTASKTTTTTTVSKSSTLRTTKSITTSSKTVKVENKEIEQKVSKDERAQSEPEKGSLEDNSKENQAVDSGLASPESPVSPQLSLTNGNHQVDVPVAEITPVIEQSGLN